MSGLISEISKLSVADRILLIQEILNTISNDSNSESNKSLSQVQEKEIDYRSESIKSGEAKTISWNSIEEKLKQRYDL